MQQLTYQQTLHYLLEQLPMFQRVGAAAYRADLGNIIQLCDILGNPQNDLKCIHVAGTNGKGSVTHLLASILQEQGYRVGVFVSPHYKDYRERIKINGKYISKKFVTDFVGRNIRAFKKVNASFFEITTAMAFAYFKEKKVDYAVIETGMGGRLDSTNIITPVLSVITNISFDHQQFLGNTLPKIALEKAGIIKSKVPVVIGETQQETTKVFMRYAKQKNARIYFADTSVDSARYQHLLPGPYQHKNIATTQKTAEILRNLGVKISETAIRRGIKNVAPNTSFIGRWMVMKKQPLVIFDSAHNEAGLKELVKGIRRMGSAKQSRIHFVYGTVSDKVLTGCLSILPKNAIYYFCKADIPRGKDANELKKEAEKFKMKGEAYASVEKAYQAALAQAKTNDRVIVSGSIFVVAEAL